MKKAKAQLPEEKAPTKAKKPFGVVALKHKMVLNNIAKNVGKGRKVNMTKTVEESGYSHSYARSGRILKTKSFPQLADEYMPDELLAKTHNELLGFKKLDYMLFNSEVSDDDIYELMEKVGCVPKKIIHGIQGIHVYFWQPDGRIRKDAVDLAYKVKGHMAPEKFEIEQAGIRTMTDEELAIKIKEQKARFSKKD